MRLYRSLVVPIALYGCETLTLRGAKEERLLVFEMAALSRWKVTDDRPIRRETRVWAVPH
jgi:hypothetical protein